jgi:hypothetical protein
VAADGLAVVFDAFSFDLALLVDAVHFVVDIVEAQADCRDVEVVAFADRGAEAEAEAEAVLYA